MANLITKRDGRVVPFDESKIRTAIYMSIENNIGDRDQESVVAEVTSTVVQTIDGLQSTQTTISVERVQDIIIQSMYQLGLDQLAIDYTSYRNTRTSIRERKSALMKSINNIAEQSSCDCDAKRENANINGDTAMGTMLKFGTTTSKEYYLSSVLPTEPAEAHRSGLIHIHDLDFYTLTTTCCQIDIGDLLSRGFSTGHGHLRPPSNINSAAALACIAIQSNQNDQHGGQSIPTFDYGLAPYVAKTFIRNICRYLDMNEVHDDYISTIKERLESYISDGNSIMSESGQRFTSDTIYDIIGTDYVIPDMCVVKSLSYTDKETYQAMEALVHNLNTMNSRAGAQVPFSSLNFGTDTTEEGRMVSKNLMLAQEAGLGNGETSIFPITIFKVKEGINYNPEDPNYDLFKLACRVSAKRLFPNFAFIDAPYNLEHYKPGKPGSEIAYMGCRTRVLTDVNDPDNNIVTGRGNLSFTSINLPRLAIESMGDMDKFYDSLHSVMELCVTQLLHRYSLQCDKTIKNYPFLMGQGLWIHSNELRVDDTLEDVLKHGTLSIGFIGLAETLIVLTGKHHGESESSQQLGLEIISFMRKFTDEMCEKYGLNFSLLATPAEGLSGRFVKMDRERYGIIDDVTDKEYYTNSFHVPVYYPITAFKKIQTEAPYHALTNAGHISYVELDGDPSTNLQAFERIIRFMKDSGMGYGSINHPVDRDPICGYVGIIGDTCPCCGRKDGEPLTPEVYKNILATNRLGGVYGK